MQTKEIRLWSKASPQTVYEKFASSLEKNGFVVNNSDSCVYSKMIGSDYMIICLYVDDMMILVLTCLLSTRLKDFCPLSLK